MKNSEELRMKSEKKIKIVSMGKYLPKKVPSTDIEERYNIPSGWSEKYSGVKSRHQVTFEHNGYMGAKAADEALTNAKMKLDDMCLLISASGTYDYPIPNQASIIKQEMRDGHKSDVPAIDIDSTCLSFVSAFEYACRMLDGINYKNILIISSEISSKGLNPDNWETLTLFGDAAVATILSYDEKSNSTFIKAGLKTYSEGAELTIIKGGGNKNHFKENPYTDEMYTFNMQGKNLLRLARKKLPNFMDWFFNDIPYELKKIDAIIPHQASKTGMIIFENLYQLKKSQVKATLKEYGNCIAASIPLTLYNHIENGEIKRGDVCLLLGTSAGFSIGASLFKY